MLFHARSNPGYSFVRFGEVMDTRSRQDALRACIREMAEQGIPAFVDRSGREWTPEAYINMDIRTTVSNTAHAAQFARMDENDEAYQLSQKQRYLERHVRKAKRECMMLDAVGDKEGFRQAFVRLKDRKRAMNNFLEESGRTMRADRTQVVGFNRSLARKTNVAVETYSKTRYHKDGTIVVTDDWKPKGKVNNVPKKYISNAVVETQTTYKNGTIQVDRTLYDADGIMYK